MIDNIGWGFLLWLFGFLAGVVLYFLVPINYIGWIVKINKK